MPGTTRFRNPVAMSSTLDLSAATVTPQVGSVAPAANAACAILSTTTEILLTVSSAANTAISTTSSVAGQEIYIRMQAYSSTGSYTLAVTGGTLTLNSLGEAAIIQRSAANDAWFVKALTASSSTGANIATIV